MKTILISPDTPFLNNRLFDITDKAWNQDNRFTPYYKLQQELYKLGYELKTIDLGNPSTADKIIITDIPPQHAKHFQTFRYCVEQGFQNKLVCLLIESPAVVPYAWDPKMHGYFSKIITWNDDLIDNKKYFKICYPQPFPEHIPFVPFKERKLCTMIIGNKTYNHPLELYTERIHAIRAMENLCPYHFDLYGTNWNEPVTQLQSMLPFLVPHYPSYRGTVTDKFAVLSKYKFSICYENLIGVPGFSGYITEKIHHCFMSNCIPVYLGANNITNYVPANTFIDRRNFRSYEELFAHLIQMKESEFMHYIQNIQEYLRSQLFAHHFSVETFANKMVTYLTT